MESSPLETSRLSVEDDRQKQLLTAPPRTTVSVAYRSAFVLSFQRSDQGIFHVTLRTTEAGVGKMAQWFRTGTSVPEGPG